VDIVKSRRNGPQLSTRNDGWITRQNEAYRAIFCTLKTVRVREKVIKLREERQLLARFLVIQQSRPELVPKLPAIIGDYKMSVHPRSLFASDGSLLIHTDKSSFMHAIEEQNAIDEPEEPSDRNAEVQGYEAEVDPDNDMLIDLPREENGNVNNKAVII